MSIIRWEHEDSVNQIEFEADCQIGILDELTYNVWQVAIFTGMESTGTSIHIKKQDEEGVFVEHMAVGGDDIQNPVSLSVLCKLTD